MYPVPCTLYPTNAALCNASTQACFSLNDSLDVDSFSQNAGKVSDFLEWLEQAMKLTLRISGWVSEFFDSRKGFSEGKGQ